MFSIQKFFMRILPHAWAEEMQAQSRRRMRCHQCGQNTWHTLSYKE